MLGSRNKSRSISKQPPSPKIGKLGNKFANGRLPEPDEYDEIPEERPPTFITVHFGNNQRAILNTSCKSRALVEHIRRKCKCSKSVTLDLIDLEGQMKNLYKSESCDYSRTSDVLSRGEYILIKVDQPSQSGPTKYTSMLNTTAQRYPEIQDRLNELMQESEAKFAAKRAEDQARLKQHAEAGWKRLRSSIKNAERTKDVIRAMTERKKARGSRGSLSSDRRKSVDFRKQSEGKNKKKTHSH